MKLSLTLLALILCLNLSAQKDKKVTSKWFDGNTGFPAPSADDFTSVKKGVILYSIFNDEKNIYIQVKITESIEQNKILQMGLTLWINNDGRSRKINGIRYPLGVKYSRGRRRPGEGTSSISNTSPLAAANTVELIGFKNIEEKRFPSDNTDNIRGSIKYDNDGNLIYSMIVPISKIPAEAKKPQEKPVPYTFAIEYGGLPTETARPQSAPSEITPSPGGGARPGGGGGRGGGSMGGGGSAGMPGPTGGADIPESTIIWIKEIPLAEKK